METVLYLAHIQHDGTLPRVALETLTAAGEISKNLSTSFVIGLVGGDLKKAEAQVRGSGASKMFGVQGEEFSHSRYSSDILAVEALVRKANATVILVPATSRFARVLPGAAVRLNGRIDTHVSGIKVTGGKLEIQRWYYRQRLVSTFSRAVRPWFLLVDSGIFPTWEGKGASIPMEILEVDLSDSANKTEVLGFESPSSSTQTIRPDAKLLFVAGAGWTKKQGDGKTHPKEAEAIILGFLSKTQASLGSSKSLVDQSSEGEPVLGFMSHLNQVGQTGSTPRHPKGLSTCCHGEEPHVVGWRFINERRAVNLDPNCGWAQGKTDVLYVADAFQVMTKVNELLNS